jgi:hypothetical protein
VKNLSAHTLSYVFLFCSALISVQGFAADGTTVADASKIAGTWRTDNVVCSSGESLGFVPGSEVDTYNQDGTFTAVTKISDTCANKLSSTWTINQDQQLVLSPSAYSGDSCTMARQAYSGVNLGVVTITTQGVTTTAMASILDTNCKSLWVTVSWTKL